MSRAHPGRGVGPCACASVARRKISSSQSGSASLETSLARLSDGCCDKPGSRLPAPNRPDLANRERDDREPFRRGAGSAAPIQRMPLYRGGDQSDNVEPGRGLTNLLLTPTPEGSLP